MKTMSARLHWDRFIIACVFVAQSVALVAFGDSGASTVGARKCDTAGKPTRAEERCKGQVLGTVFLDLNQNGIREAGEPGRPSVEVFLLCKCRNQRLKTTTNAEGYFSFPSISPDSYWVQTAEATGLVATTAVSVDIDVQCGRSIFASFGSIPGVMAVRATPPVLAPLTPSIPGAASAPRSSARTSFFAAMAAPVITTTPYPAAARAQGFTAIPSPAGATPAASMVLPATETGGVVGRGLDKRRFSDAAVLLSLTGASLAMLALIVGPLVVKTRKG